MYENSILKDIENVQTVYIAGHINPDGDAVGSCMGFALAMAKLGKKPVILLEEYSDRFDIIKGGEYICRENYDNISPDIFFALDAGTKDRLGKAEAVFDRAKITYNIDHHISNTFYARNNIVNGKASSASEVVYEIIKDIVKVDLDIATALYSGILTDTSGFKHSCTSKRTHEIAGDLVFIGVDTPNLHSRFLYEHTMTEAKIFAKAIDNMKLENSIAYTCLTAEEMTSVGAVSKDLEGIAAYLLNTEGAEAALLATERDEGVVKLSFRSNSTDVNKVASMFGGGGHILAAGASVKGNINEITARVLKELGNRINENEQ